MLTVINFGVTIEWYVTGAILAILLSSFLPSYVSMLWSPKVCDDVHSTSLLGGSGGMPPQENFEKLIYRDGF